MPGLNGPACEWHEERISRNETSLNEVAVQMAGLAEQLKHVGERVGEVGLLLEGRIAEFREANDDAHRVLKGDVEDLKDKQATQAESIKILLAEHEARTKRLDAAKSAGKWAILAVLAAIATKWGEAIFDWLTKKG